MDDTWNEVVHALAAAGIEAELERNGVGQLLLTIRGEAVDDWRDDGPWVTVVAHESAGAEPITPTELAVQMWGPSEGHSRSQGARRIRAIARELFPDKVPGQGHEWQLTPAQVAEVRHRLLLG